MSQPEKQQLQPANGCSEEDRNLKQTRAWKLFRQKHSWAIIFLRLQINIQISDIKKNDREKQEETLFIL